MDRDKRCKTCARTNSSETYKEVPHDWPVFLPQLSVSDAGNRCIMLTKPKRKERSL